MAVISTQGRITDEDRSALERAIDKNFDPKQPYRDPAFRAVQNVLPWFPEHRRSARARC